MGSNLIEAGLHGLSKTPNRSLNLVHVSVRRGYGGPTVRRQILKCSIMIPDYSLILEQGIHKLHVWVLPFWMQSRHLRQILLELLSRMGRIQRETIRGFPVHTTVRVRPSVITSRHTFRHKVSTGMVTTKPQGLV